MLSDNNLPISEHYLLRPIEAKDNFELMSLIKTVLKEQGADRPGFAFVDLELNNLYQQYTLPGWAYFVLERKLDHRIVGGAGLGPLVGGEPDICELKKMYILAEARGLKLGFDNCYLNLT